MEKISVFIIATATFLNALLTIMNFFREAKKPVDKAVKNKFDEALKPIKDDLNEIKGDIRRLDKNQCKNFLTNYLESLKKGEPKTDIERQRATEVYDHYRKDLKLNSYIKANWDRYMGGDEKNG